MEISTLLVRVPQTVSQNEPLLWGALVRCFAVAAKHTCNWGWCHMSTTLALGRWKQKDQEPKVILGYTLRPSGLHQILSQKKKKINKMNRACTRCSMNICGLVVSVLYSFNSLWFCFIDRHSFLVVSHHKTGDLRQWGKQTLKYKTAKEG